MSVDRRIPLDMKIILEGEKITVQEGSVNKDRQGPGVLQHWAMSPHHRKAHIHSRGDSSHGERFPAGVGKKDS